MLEAIGIKNEPPNINKIAFDTGTKILNIFNHKLANQSNLLQ